MISEHHQRLWYYDVEMHLATHLPHGSSNICFRNEWSNKSRNKCDKSTCRHVRDTRRKLLAKCHGIFGLPLPILHSFWYQFMLTVTTPDKSRQEELQHSCAEHSSFCDGLSSHSNGGWNMEHHLIYTFRFIQY
mmetsp:Transcript_26134/g.38300  ORF Transcript_26134/g.38300 Transcript_26134/m.38300 type:complete len:133 (+) Transcript_26134:149-547(+)